MNKKIFNGKQFAQTFMQLKTIGIIFTILLTAMMVFTPISSMASIKENIELYGANIDLPYVVNLSRQLLPMIVTYVLYTPLLTLTCWNFLTKRNACDFYQSLPYTRVCTYVTHVAAMVAWQIITFVMAGVAGAVTYAALSNYFIVDYGTMLLQFLNIFACNLLCMAAITLACTITGNLFSNVIVSGMIIFLPRFLVKMFSTITTSILPILSSEHMFSVLGSDYNILVESVLAFLGISDSSFFSLFISVHGTVYMVVLALIYVAVACVIFNKRKSETAGNGAGSKLVQAVIRITIGFSISYFGVLASISTLRNYGMNMDYISGIVLCFAIAAGAMLLYEGINVKSAKGALKSLPSVAIAFALSILAGFATNGYLAQAQKFQPEAENVKSITMKASSYYYEEYDNYFTDYVSQIEISSDEIEKIFCDALKENVEKIGQETHGAYSYIYNKTQYTVGFKTGATTTYRNVYLTTNQVAQVKEKLQNVEEYRTAMLNLPDSEDASVSINGGNVALTKDQIRELYESMVTECREISFADWYDLTNNYDYNLVFSVLFTKNGTMYQATIKLDETLPKTFAKYASMVNEASYDSDSYDKLVERLKSLPSTVEQSNNNYYLSLYVAEQGKEPQHYSVEEYLRADADAQKILKNATDTIAKKDKNATIDPKKSYMEIDYYEQDLEGESKNSASVYVPIER